MEAQLRLSCERPLVSIAERPSWQESESISQNLEYNLAPVAMQCHISNLKYRIPPAILASKVHLRSTRPKVSNIKLLVVFGLCLPLDDVLNFSSCFKKFSFWWEKFQANQSMSLSFFLIRITRFQYFKRVFRTRLHLFSSFLARPRPCDFPRDFCYQ